jgi:hypothetical protein
MRVDKRRITLVTRQTRGEQRDWVAGSASRIILVDSLKVLSYALDNGIHDLHEDVERVIIDRAATAAEFLEMLSALPPTFVGDVLLVRDDGSAFLSAEGARGNRVLYQLAALDVDFYLEALGLVASERAATMAPASEAASVAVHYAH